MLLKTEIVNTASAKHLISIWSQLYAPDLSALPFAQNPLLYSELLETASPTGRASTAAKLHKQIEITCEVSSVQTNSLYNYMQSKMDLREVGRLADVTLKVYMELLELYRQHPVSQTLSSLSAVELGAQDLSLSSLGIPDIEQFANTLEPILLEFQEEHALSEDWRTFGFLTTQFSFCNQWLVKKLTPIEQVLLSPYFKFVEEHISHPWPRVCAAAAQHSINSPVLTLAATMIPMGEEIAQTVYQRLNKLIPYHRSRRGGLNNPEVTHSCIRDLEMFQAYFWLCVLEGSMAPIEQELLGFYVMVLPSLGVKWELIEMSTHALADEIINRIESSQQQHVLPYIRRMHQAFLNARESLDTPLARLVSDVLPTPTASQYGEGFSSQKKSFELSVL